MPGKEDITDYLAKVAGNMSKYSTEVEMFSGVMPSTTRLADDGHGARVNARIDNGLKGKGFNEEGTPPEELETVEQDTEDELINRVVEELLGE
tara:strand:+ start:1621 stop:1899 length:279 start_codon:yes stop_codon:yes gene_type:complete